MKLLTRALDIMISKSMLKTSLVGVPWVEVLGTDGVRSQNRERLPGLDEDETC